MSTLPLGWNANGRALRLDADLRGTTHMHVIGGSGTGKSKFLEHLIRNDIREGQGLCVLDWHGELYNHLLRWSAFHDIGLPGDYRPLILMNPSQPDFVTGFNPFQNPGQEISTAVSRWIDATVRPWGEADTDAMPTFERTCRVLYTFMAEAKETLPNAAHLLDPERRDLRAYALKVVKDTYTRSQLKRFQNIKTSREWEDKVLSTENRLGRFIASKGVKRFMGLNTNNIDLLDLMENQKIVLVNLGQSDFLDRKAAQVFASEFLYDFFHAAMSRANEASRRGEKPKLYILYLDEFQQYITEDIADMLDEVRKGGLHIVLAHQHLGHLVDNPRLKESIFTNARIRAVFGGLTYPSACELANEMFLPDLNTRQIKKAYYHTIHLYREETRIVRGHSHSAGSFAASGTGASAGSFTGASGETEGWSTDSSTSSYGVSGADTDSETEVPVFVPIPVQELSSETEWTREEKLSKIAEMLKCQQQRHCFIKLDTEKTQPLKVPLVREHGVSPASLAEYEEAVYKTQGALPAAQVDALLAQSEQKFLGPAEKPPTRTSRKTAPMLESTQPSLQTPDTDDEEFTGPQFPPKQKGKSP